MMGSRAPIALEAAPIRLSYFVRIPNVGDLINPTLVAAVAGTQTIRSTRGVHLLAAGSILASAKPESVVWGTGAMGSDFGVGASVAANIVAVRGERSLTELRKNGVLAKPSALGDPGYLAPALFGLKRAARPRFALGIVPHYTDRAIWHVRRIAYDSEVRLLNVHDDPLHFLNEMSECAAIASSSLHGLIFAEALAIPNVWITIGDQIAGGRFKFEDWFTTTARPQVDPVQVGAGTTCRQLVDRAELRDSKIDVRALKESFPSERLAELSEPPRRLVPATVCRPAPVPAFLISFNRGRFLKKATDAIGRLKTPTQIVVHDNGSDDGETIAILKQMETEGCIVRRRAKINSPDELNNVNETVQEFFRDWGEPKNYVVSDGDIDVSDADQRLLDLYAELLARYREVSCVGPMLRIDDIDPNYPLYGRVMNRHIEQFWQHVPSCDHLPGFGVVWFQPAKIDTTFALHRAGEPFRRLKDGLRTYRPFEARHLDWYLQHFTGTFANSASPRISHWGTQSALDTHGRETLKYDRYFAIDREGDRMTIVEKTVA
jgi:hypothetical protein